MKNPRWAAALAFSACALLAAPSAQAGAPSNWVFTKAFGAANIPLNGSTSLTFNLANNSLSAAGNIAFSDAFPAGLVVATPNGLSGNCNGTVTATAGAGSVSLTGGSLASNSTCSIAVNVTGTTPGVKNNITSVLTSDLLPNPAGATATLTVLAALASAASIPTLSEWGLILLVLAMAASAFNAVRRKR